MSWAQRPVLALVPARGGSVGIPRKNLRVVRGKPLVAHTVEAALASTVVDRVYLSSDDEEILALGRTLGVETIKRESALASNQATAAEVVADFIARLPVEISDSDPYLVYLQPTSPLRTAEHIDAAFAELQAQRGSYGLSVKRMKDTPYKAFTLSESRRLQSLFDSKLSNANRQSLPEVYYPNGAIYIFPVSEFLAHGGFPSNGGVAYLMSEQASLDIDSESDLAMMEL
jgi:CMP-N,N'-diacetyllegionaminic acid synthase